MGWWHRLRLSGAAGIIAVEHDSAAQRGDGSARRDRRGSAHRRGNEARWGDWRGARPIPKPLAGPGGSLAALP